MKKRVTFDAKKLAAAQRKGNSGYVDRCARNLYGAYTEDLLAEFIGGVKVVDLSHINKGGIDYAGLSGNTLKIGEAKAVKNDLYLSDLDNYIKKDEITGALEFNTNYVIRNIGGDSYFKDPAISKEFVLYINSPESVTIKNSLISQLGGASQIPYKYTKDEQIFTGTVEIVIEAVNK